ncbi:uncharacterized protein EHS24_002138 [Apiotrichum porosum]|uniref:Uncharacterized protein n=1 Tax=Apiotrichum porosum TaxID=105984 RepID=A0A427XI16_9TREE|nr:uncharacterized protein EHS24_002138 [Apiotrichum porosum]RSH78413.1 hypothetical protein EHS24_002138 [Apiotrichum porosum]
MLAMLAALGAVAFAQPGLAAPAVAPNNNNNNNKARYYYTSSYDDNTVYYYQQAWFWPVLVTVIILKIIFWSLIIWCCCVKPRREARRLREKNSGNYIPIGAPNPYASAQPAFQASVTAPTPIAPNPYTGAYSYQTPKY